MRAPLILLITFILQPLLSAAQEVPLPQQVLFKNVNVFNGTDARLYDVEVLIENNLIKKVGKSINARTDATVIDGGGRTLMPGMHDQHCMSSECFGQNMMQVKRCFLR